MANNVKISVYQGGNNIGEWNFEEMPRRGELVKIGQQWWRVDEVVHKLAGQNQTAESGIRVLPYQG